MRTFALVAGLGILGACGAPPVVPDSIPATPQYIDASMRAWDLRGNPGPRPIVRLVTELNCAWDESLQLHTGYDGGGRCLGGHAICPFIFVAYYGQLPHQSALVHENEHCALAYIFGDSDPRHDRFPTWETCHEPTCVGGINDTLRAEGF